MPHYIKFSDVKLNIPLYNALSKLFSDWGAVGVIDVQEDENDPFANYENKLACLIAHQSSLEELVRADHPKARLTSSERIALHERYLKALEKARSLWMEMEMEDQISLKHCIRQIDSGHQIIHEIGIRPFYLSFSYSEEIEEWRKKELIKNRHESWGIDTEILDLLISAGKKWIIEEKPSKGVKIDPSTYAVMYIAKQCNKFGINPSPTPSSRFTKIIDTYFKHTTKNNDNTRECYKDLIKKANKLLSEQNEEKFSN